MSRKISILTVFASLFLCQLLCTAKKTDSEHLRAYITFDKESAYQGEVFIATLWLEHDGYRISYLGSEPGIAATNATPEFQRPLDIQHREKRAHSGNGTFSALPVAAFAIKMGDHGTVKFESPEIEVGIDYVVKRQNPFWGQTNALESRILRVKPESKSIKIKKLPINKEGHPFSGAVGNYSISLQIPPGEIVIDNSALALIKLQGTGILPEDVIPDYNSTFKDDIKLKSIKNRNNIAFNGKEIESSITWECEIIPKEAGDCKIGSVKFCFFNPTTGRYENIESQPVTINVKSSTVKRESFDI